ncbi:glycosyltransferase [Ornithinimicrobium faecis]|uniref:Glycosyltransferase n=1 Tax=Ornithinimicrobium faecis TaxID=2934158 RepID=A0ABY4YTI3_9MICO|nr:glycosyltransferase [Ornithinimicrobium sp. HY1793]USQ79879.1 glycosyltransferase [Ornithinimicrobium sp. HY1793]
MSRSLADSVRSARTAFWHLRKGGLGQVRSWRSRRINVPGRELSGSALRRALIRTGTFTAEDVPQWPVADRAPRRPGLRVGVIMDTFSARAWGYEFEVLELTSDGWQEQLAAQPIDLLFVESAWAGSSGSWRYQLTGSKAPTESLQALVGHCREQQIPSVFWNKEDPPHFDDFLDTARLFDQVFTTDENLLKRYREELGHDRVEVLGFAAQPVLHHPIRHKEVYQARDIAFGGSYWSHKFPERQAQMDLLLGAAVEVAARRDQRFDIYSRFDNDPKYRFPEHFDGYVRGSLDYDQMLTAYRLHKVMLNVNSVVDSPTMMARRVFEILASGTPVVSTRSPAVEHWFPGGEVAIVDDADEAALTLRALLGSPELRDRMVHRAQRRIWREHTFSARAGQVLGAVGLTDPVGTGLPTVSVIAPTIRPHLMRGIVETAARQQDVRVQLVLLAHGFTPPEADLTALAKDLGLPDLVVLQAEDATSLGVNLNALVAASDGDLIAKLDDDDLYGDHYLADSAHALDYSGADLVGKHARFTYLADVGATVLQYPQREHRWTDLVGGPTMVAPRTTFVETPFADRTLGEDTTFQRALLAAGGSIYSADRFNFIQMRGSSGDHTWSTEDEQILANGRVQAYGLVTDHVLF